MGDEPVSELTAEAPGEGTEIWARALASLQERIKPHNFDMWLRPIRCESIEGTCITLRLPVAQVEP